MKNKVLLFLSLILLCGCQKNYAYDYAIFQNIDNKTVVNMYNRNLKLINKKQINKNIALPYSDTIINKDKLYDIHYQSDSNQLLEVNLDNFSTKTISKLNEHPSVVSRFNNELIYSSNYVENNYATIINLVTKKQYTKEMNDLQIIKCVNNTDYSFILDNKNNYHLAINNYSNNQIKFLKKLEKEISPNNNPIVDQEKLYYIDIDNDLIIIDLKTFNSTKIKLNLDSYGKMFIYDNKLHILNADNTNLSKVKPIIDIIDLKTFKIKSFNIKEAINDYKLENNIMYALSQKKLMKINLDTLKITKEIELEQNGYYGKIIKKMH